jgi:glycosyltransferase involved in cell wall biosynthesis
MNSMTKEPKGVTKIAIFSASSLTNYGGGEQALILLANSLTSRGVHVTVFDYRFAKARRLSLGEIRTQAKFQIVEYGGIQLFGIEQIPLTPSYVSALLGCRNYDAVYTTNSALTHTIPLWCIAKILKKPTIFEVSDPSFDPVALARSSRSERLLKYFRKAVILRFERIRVLNRADQRRYERNWNEVHLLPPPSREFRPNIEECDCFTVLFAARGDVLQKGIDMLSEIVAKVLKSAPDVRFVIIGSGEEGERVFRQLQTLFPGRVEWRGFVSSNELATIYQDSQLFILPSRYETFGMTVLEALRNGMPVVAFDVPGPSDIITAESQGVLVRPFEIDTFVSRILEFHARWKMNPAAYAVYRKEIIRATELRINNDVLLEGLCHFLLGRPS